MNTTIDLDIFILPPSLGVRYAVRVIGLCLYSLQMCNEYTVDFFLDFFKELSRNPIQAYKGATHL